MQSSFQFLRACAIGLIAAASTIQVAAAQQPTNSPSATLPGPGLFTYRPMFRFDKFSDAPGGADGKAERFRFMNHVMYGVAPEWGLFADLSFVDRDVETPGGDDDESGLGDTRLGVSHRFYRNDFGPIETFRAAANFSLRMPTGDEEFTNDTVNPSFGISTTTILGRHGIGSSARYEITTGATDSPVDAGDGLADHLMLAGSHLYRIRPESYAEGGNVAVYSQVELLGHFETNGDASLDAALGVLVEAPRWAAECSVILPVAQDLDERPESELGLALGVRFLF